MQYLKNTLLLAALTFAFIATSIAQTRETGISVTVRDQFGDAIADAEIVLGKSDSDKAEKLIKTDGLGVGQFSKLY